VRHLWPLHTATRRLSEAPSDLDHQAVDDEVDYAHIHQADAVLDAHLHLSDEHADLDTRALDDVEDEHDGGEASGHGHDDAHRVDGDVDDDEDDNEDGDDDDDDEHCVDGRGAVDDKCGTGPGSSPGTEDYDDDSDHNDEPHDH